MSRPCVHYDPKGAVVADFDPSALPATYLLEEQTVRQEWIGGLDPTALEAVEQRIRELATK